MDTKTTIKSNKQWRNFLYGYELTEKQKAEFDYIADIDSHHFIKYKGRIIDPGEFISVPMDSFLDVGWHGYQADGFFSGLVIRISDDGEQYKIGTYFS